MPTTHTLSTTGPDGTHDVVRFSVYNDKTWAITNADTQMFQVNKTQTLNASARGGAYKTVWVARRGGLKVTRDTRKDATEAMIRLLRRNGFTV